MGDIARQHGEDENMADCEKGVVVECAMKRDDTLPLAHPSLHPASMIRK